MQDRIWNPTLHILHGLTCNFGMVFSFFALSCVFVVSSAYLPESDSSSLVQLFVKVTSGRDVNRSDGLRNGTRQHPADDALARARARDIFLEQSKEFVDHWGLGAFAEVADVFLGKNQAASFAQWNPGIGPNPGLQTKTSEVRSLELAWALQGGMCERPRPAHPWHRRADAVFPTSPQLDGSDGNIHFVSSTQKIPQAHQSGIFGNLSFQGYQHICYVAGGILAVVAILFETFHWRMANIDFNKPLPRITDRDDDKVRLDLSMLFAGVCRLCYPFWFNSPARLKARCLIVAIMLLMVLSTFFMFVGSMFTNAWMLALQLQDVAGLKQLAVFNIFLIGTSTLETVYTNYLGGFLLILWREHMTLEFASLWTAEHANYYMKLAGNDLKLTLAEQRIQEDIGIFTGTVLSLFLTVWSSLLRLVMFLPLFLSMMPTKFAGLFPLPGWLLYVLLIWCFTGFVIKHLIGRRQIVLSWLGQDTEAKLRHSLSSMRTNAEAIRLMGTQSHLTAQTLATFDTVKVVWWQSMVLGKWLTWFDILYQQLESTGAQLLLLPAYVTGELGMNDYFQLNGICDNMSDVIDLLVNNYGTLTELRATTDRLLAFCDNVAKAQEYNKQLPAILHPPQGAHFNFALRATFGTITSPSGETLWSDLSLEVLPGKKILLSGPDGSGKSTLLFALYGIWPFLTKSQIEVGLAYSDKLFVPSRYIIPEWCTLAEAVTYPDPRGKWSDEELYRVLQDVGLGSQLKDDESGDLLEGTPRAMLRQTSPHKTSAEGTEPYLAPLDKIDNWTQVLSTGMLQRLSIAHVILRRPRMLLLDEATSALPPSAATALYSLMLASLPEDAIVVCASHQVDCMRPLHTTHWEVKLEDPGAAATKQLLKTNTS